MRVDQLFVIERRVGERIPEAHPRGANPSRDSMCCDCVCTDPVAVDDMAFDQRVAWKMSLCNGSNAVLECRLATLSSMLGGRIESQEEAQERDRVHIIEMGTNRREFVVSGDLGNQTWGVLERSFLDRTGNGLTHCCSLRVLLPIGCYGELPDYRAQLNLMRKALTSAHDPSGLMPPGDWLAAQTLKEYSGLGERFVVDAPAFLPIEVVGGLGRESVRGVLEIVSALPRPREFNARLFSRARADTSPGDTLTRTVHWNSGCAEKRLSVEIGTII